MRVVLLSSLPPEQTTIADFAARWRLAANEAGVDVLTPMQGQKPLANLAEARRWVAERDWSKVDAVHAQLGRGRRSEFLILCALARLKGRPALSATVHEPDRLIWGAIHRGWTTIERLPGPLRGLLTALSEPHSWWVERRLARKMEGLVAMTDTGAKALSRRLGVSLERIGVIPHGALRIAEAPLPSEGAVRLLHFGFVRSGKGIEVLIDALARAIAQDATLASRLTLTIAGGTSADPTYGRPGGYLDRLRKRVQDKGVVGQVEWELDVDGRDIPALIQRHHVVLLPKGGTRPAIWLGRRRSSSGAMSWATACGRGVIAPAVRTYAEEVKDGLGVVYRPGDVDALASHLQQLVAEPQAMQAWALAAAQRAARQDWSAVGQMLRQHFDAVVARQVNARNSTSS
jgi:glycosyltransferase involved in cell wall biosynthesis